MTNTTCLAVSQVERLEPVIHETTTNNRWMVCLTKNYLQNIMHKNVSTIYLIHLRQNAIITFSTCHQLILSKRHNKKLFLISRSKDAVFRGHTFMTSTKMTNFVTPNSPQCVKKENQIYCLETKQSANTSKSSRPAPSPLSFLKMT